MIKEIKTYAVVCDECDFSYFTFLSTDNGLSDMKGVSVNALAFNHDFSVELDTPHKFYCPTCKYKK